MIKVNFSRRQIIGYYLEVVTEDGVTHRITDLSEDIGRAVDEYLSRITRGDEE